MSNSEDVKNEQSVAIIATVVNLGMIVFAIINGMKMSSLSYDNVLFPNLYALTALLPFFLAHFLTISILYYNVMPDGGHRGIFPFTASMCMFFVSTNIAAILAFAAAIWIPYASIKPKETGSKQGQTALIIVMCGFLIYSLGSPPYDWYYVQPTRTTAVANTQDDYDYYLASMRKSGFSSVYIYSSEELATNEAAADSSVQLERFTHHNITEEAYEQIAYILGKATTEHDAPWGEATPSTTEITFRLLHNSSEIYFVYYLDKSLSDAPEGFTRIRFAYYGKPSRYLALENKYIEELLELLEECRDESRYD